MASADGRVQRHTLVRALLWLAGLVLAMFAVSCVLTSAAEAKPLVEPPALPEKSLHDLVKPIDALLGTGQKPAKAPKPVTPERERPEEPVEASPLSKPKPVKPEPVKPKAGLPILGTTTDAVAGPVDSVLGKDSLEPVAPILDLVGETVNTATKPVAPILELTQDTVIEPVAPVVDLAENTVADAVDAVAPVLGLLEEPVRVLSPVLDLTGDTVAGVVQPVATVLEPVLGLAGNAVAEAVTPILELVGKPVAVLVRATTPVLGLVEHTVSPILGLTGEAVSKVVEAAPQLPHFPGGSAWFPGACAAPGGGQKQQAAGTPLPQPIQPRHAQAANVAALHENVQAATTHQQKNADAAATESHATTRKTGSASRSEKPLPSPGKGSTPHPVVPAPASSGANTTPHSTPAWSVPESRELVLGYVVSYLGDDLPLWRSIKPGSRPD
ncbi:hypothetical protein [Amycolatopsis magusensis]|uniref:hypothetical protein n=1 Tax=Amycolatopsis magusensis TaxID=882444 RepID=UPI003C2CBEA6